VGTINEHISPSELGETNAKKSRVLAAAKGVPV
jgi:hypothetical protein